jgi:hypothetical protein
LTLDFSLEQQLYHRIKKVVSVFVRFHCATSAVKELEEMDSLLQSLQWKVARLLRWSRGVTGPLPVLEELRPQELSS